MAKILMPHHGLYGHIERSPSERAPGMARFQGRQAPALAAQLRA